MRLGRYEIENGLLTSKVARRVFVLFILCALLPVSALALVSFFEVRSSLADQVEVQLRSTAKLTGLGILEKLLFADSNLSLISQRNILDAETAGRLDTALLGESADRFSSLFLLNDAFPMARCETGESVDLRELSPDKRQRLEYGPLVLTAPTAAGSYSVSILHPTGSAGQFLWATVRPEFLWGTQGTLVNSEHLFVVDGDGNPLYASEDPTRALAAWKSRADEASRRVDWSVGDQHYAGAFWTLFMRHNFGTEWIILHGVEDEIAFAVLEDFRTIFLLVIALTLLVVLTASLNQIRLQLVPIGQLAAVTKRISERDFSARVQIDTKDEFAQLGQSFNSMAESLEHYIHLVETSNAIGNHLSGERDPRAFLTLVLAGVCQVTCADGAAVYTFAGEDIDLCLVQVESLDLDTVDPLELPISPGAGRRFLENTQLDCDRPRSFADFALQNEVSPSPFAGFEKKHNYQIRSLLSIPLWDREEGIVGVMQVFNKMEQGHSVPFSEDDNEVAQSLATQAAVSFTKNQLVDRFQGLFESMTNLITVAIDEKSPYTGGHCQRVPVASMMLAEATCRTAEGRFAEFDLTPEELYELKIASLLHDCGKVATPVHVVDKATKLETILDRIELVETRFQALKAQKELALAEAPEAERPSLQSEILTIDDDMEFLRYCNSGTEWMAKENQERVLSIAQKYQWLSPRNQLESILTEDEVENLTISRGTLTEAEREIINNHIVSTIRMLGMLNYPKNLQRVPEIAGNHHEKLDGTGYPRGVSADGLSTQSRILAFADVFEALTANDRPYKDGKKLSEVFRILDHLTKSGHLDRDLFEVFIREEVHVRYSELYLKPDQVDELDFLHLLESPEAGDSKDANRRTA